MREQDDAGTQTSPRSQRRARQQLESGPPSYEELFNEEGTTAMSLPPPYPGQPEEYPGQPEECPGQPEECPGQPEEYPGQPEEYPGQPEECPGQPEECPGQPEECLGQSEEYPEQPVGAAMFSSQSSHRTQNSEN